MVSDPNHYHHLIENMKNAPTKEEYLNLKKKFDDLISTQHESKRNSLKSFINLWHERAFRWVLAYKNQTCDIPKSSLAEAAHAKMKSAGRKNLSLAASAIADIEDAAMLEGQWQRRQDGGKSRGTGPTGKVFDFDCVYEEMCPLNYAFSRKPSILHLGFSYSRLISFSHFFFQI